MTAKIYLFKRRDNKIFTNMAELLTDLGYKLQKDARGRAVAVPPDEFCICPECSGTGSIRLLDGCYIPCLSCESKGVY